MRPTLIAAVFIPLISAARPALAVDDEELARAYGDAQTVSIATGSRQPLRRAPAVTTVITARDIAIAGASDLDQALALVPGLHVSATPVLYTPVYAIRGLVSYPSNTQVLILHNGQPMTTAFSSDKGNTWGGLPLDNVLRIEVIRGPGSALYGADAFSGVINIISKSPADTQGSELGLRVGSFGSRDAWLQHGAQLGELALAAYVRAGQTRGAEPLIRADAASRFDGLFGTRASLAPGPANLGRETLDAGLELGLDQWKLRAFWRSRKNVETGAGVNSALDPDSRGHSERWMADLSWNAPQFGAHWSLGASLGFHSYWEHYPDGLMLFPPGTRIGPNTFVNGMIGGPGRWERQLRGAAHAIYSGWSGHSLRLGIGHDDIHLYRASTHKNFLLGPTGVPVPTGPVIDYGEIQPHIRPRQRRISYAYLQDEWQLAPDWTLTAGLRSDHYSDFGRTTNPRLALVWEAGYNLSLKLLHGRAFRAPGFSEQATINPVSTGNPDLRPERIATSELALAWQPRDTLSLNLSLFRYRAQDLIRVVANPPPATGATFQNVGRQHGRGGELELLWDATPRLRLAAQAALQRATDPASGRDIGYAPEQQLQLRADWHPQGDWSLSAIARHAGERRRAANDPRPALRDNNALDLVLRQDGGLRRWSWSLSLRNALDADLREPTLPGGTLPDDLPLPGRSVALEASYRW